MQNELVMPLWNARRPRMLSRNWWLRVGIVVLVTECLVLAGCGVHFASFISTAESDLPVIIQTVVNVLDSIAPQLNSSIVMSLGASTLATLKLLCGSPAPGAMQCDAASLVGEYHAAPTTTLLLKIQSALSAINANLNQIIGIVQGLVNVPQSVVLAIDGAFGIALTIINAILSLAPAAARALKVVLAPNPSDVPSTPTAPLTRAELVRRINAAFASFPKAQVQ